MVGTTKNLGPCQVKDKLPMQATDLIRLSFEIENEINADGDLAPLSKKGSTIVSISRLATEEYALFFRHDAPSEMRESLTAMDPEKALDDHEDVRHTIARCVPCKNVLAWNGCYFAHVLAAAEFPDVELRDGRHVVIVDDTSASQAWTQDGSQSASELAVETSPEFRGKGYARQAAAVWASHEIKAGRVAFYSYRLSNLASEALARSLGVVQYARSTSYS